MGESMNDSECSLSWNGSFSSSLFHNLTSHCDNDTISDFLVSPSDFFVQLIRFSLCLCAFIILLACYNTLSVMNRQMLSTATCSVYWVLMTVAMALKSLVLMVFPIMAWNIDPKGSEEVVDHVNLAGFLVQAVLQAIASFLLFLALDHERMYRSSDAATVDKPTKGCIAMTCSWKLFYSWPRVVALMLTALTLAILVALEVVFGLKQDLENSHHVEMVLVWVYIISLPLTRLAAVLLGVVLVCRHGNRLSPTITAKVFLVLGLALSLMEDFPNFVTSCHDHLTCQLFNHMSVFALLQLVGILALVFFVLFMRSQYLRVEQESKLHLVWDLQKLLQVNGRKNIIRHYNS